MSPYWSTLTTKQRRLIEVLYKHEQTSKAYYWMWPYPTKATLTALRRKGWLSVDGLKLTTNGKTWYEKHLEKVKTA